MPIREARLSAIDQLQKQLDDTANERLRAIPDRHIKAVMIWLESVQLHRAISVSIEDDPLENAKGRGGVELVVNLVQRLHAELHGRQEKPAESEVEDDDNE